MQVASSYLGFRSSRVRTIIEGDPIQLVQDGTPIGADLRRLRITVEELAEEARGQGIASMSQVEWGIAEDDGTISFIKR